MSVQHILLAACGVVALGGALAAIIRRNPLHAIVLLAAMCLGEAGLFLLMEAPIIAALQLFLAAGLIFMIRLAPLSVKESAYANPGLGQRWWQAAPVAAALGGILVWMAVARYGASDPSAWGLILAALLFCAGLFAVLARRDVLGVLMGFVVMLTGVVTNLVAFSGQVFAAAIYAVLVVEIAAGLAFGAALWRSRGTTALDEANLLKE